MNHSNDTVITSEKLAPAPPQNKMHEQFFRIYDDLIIFHGEGSGMTASAINRDHVP